MGVRPGVNVSQNKQVVEEYMEGFRHGDHERILRCLTDDVEWWIPGAFRLSGKPAFDREIENENFVGRPQITVTRMVEEGGVVVVEGAVRAELRAGGFLDLEFCDVFEFEGSRIRKLISYLVKV